MSTATEGGLTVSCAKPGCDWKGPAGEAPSHPCPTKAEPELEHPFAGLANVDGAPIANEEADTALPYHVIWTSEDGENIVRVGTAATEDGALEIEAMTEKGKGSVEVRYIGTAEDAAPVMAADFEPVSQGDVAAWLANFGNYDDDGVPQDEKTARLDARLTAWETGTEPAAEEEPEPGGGQPAPEPEPEVDEDEQIAASGSAPSSEAAEDEAGLPWEIKVAIQLDQQGQVAAYRWLVVDTAAGEVVGRAKVKTEGTELLANVKREASDHSEALQLVKTQDVLAKAEELQIERKRQMVPPDEPAQTPASTPEPPEEGDGAQEGETTAEPDQPADTLKDVKPSTGEGKTEKKLFDDSDFEREDLALPKVDGHSIDRIAVDVSGTVMLDRSNPDHVALFRRLKLGAKVELWVEAKGLGFAGKGATNKDGDLDVVVGRRAIAVQAIRVVPPEGLEEIAGEMAAQARDAHEAGEDAL